jgi:hypothetical protein
MSTWKYSSLEKILNVLYWTRLDNMEQKIIPLTGLKLQPLAIKLIASSYTDCFIPNHIDKKLTAHNYSLLLMRMNISVNCALNNNHHIVST